MKEGQVVDDRRRLSTEVDEKGRRRVGGGKVFVAGSEGGCDLGDLRVGQWERGIRINPRVLAIPTALS